MKCYVCGHKIEFDEIYTDWYFCNRCDKDYTIEEEDLPFKSEKQRAYLFSQKPEIAKEFAEHTTKKQEKALPKKVKKAKK